MRIECPSCEAGLQVKESLAGRIVKCPRCQHPMTVPAADSAGAEHAEILDLAEEAAPTPQVSRKPVACPMCGAKNRAAADECRECGEPLQAKSVGSVWRDGKQLVMKIGATLPYRCVKTNGEAELLLRRKLSWHHPVLFLSLCGGLLIYVILALLLRKTADVQIPICHRIKQRRLIAMLVGWVFGLSGLGIIFGAVVLSENDPQFQPYVGFVIIGGILFSLISIIVCTMLANIVSPSRITDKHVWLKGVHRDYLDELPEWPGGK